MANEATLQPGAPPKALSERKAWVQFNKLNTIVIPHDLEDDDATPWACTVNDPPTQKLTPQRSGNEVVYFIDGKEAYEQFVIEILKTKGPGDFIYLLGWFLDIDLQLAHGLSIHDLFAFKARRGVQIRVILDGQIHDRPTNIKAVDFLNLDVSQYGPAYHDALQLYNLQMRLSRGETDALPPPQYGDCIRSDSRAAGILDERESFTGCHHQKVLVVKAGDQLTAFVGGLDINPDRITWDDKGDPQHDVHCRVRGPAAADVLEVFCKRWEDWVRVFRSDVTVSECDVLGHNLKPPQPCGPFSVQIGKTFDHLTRNPFSFAKNGERSIKELLKKAIQASQRFIYIEDQYLSDPDMADVLAAQISKLQHITVLIPPGNQIESTMAKGRTKFINTLKSAGGNKFRLYCPDKGTDTCSTYVHAKIWVFDDKFAVIGSANCDHRGYTSDSEIDAGIYDPSTDVRLNYTFAHRFRLDLWAHHLGAATDAERAELVDAVACADQWEGLWAFSKHRVGDFVEGSVASHPFKRALGAAAAGSVDPKSE